MNAYETHLPVLEKVFSLKPFNTAFEYGCGFGSTPFFLNNCTKVISVEMQNAQWGFKIIEAFADKIPHRFYLHIALGPQHYDFINVYNQTVFDFAFVDGHAHSRPECINQCFALRIDTIVTHDTEEPIYDWQRVKIPVEYKEYVYKEHTPWTTLYTRDLVLYNQLIEWKSFE